MLSIIHLYFFNQKIAHGISMLKGNNEYQTIFAKYQILVDMADKDKPMPLSVGVINNLIQYTFYTCSAD